MLTAAAFVGGVAAIELLRVPGSLDTIWAEDGRVFLQQARDVGRLHAFVQPTAGYLNWIPRSVAAVAASFPLRWSAFLLAAISALGVGAFTLFVFRASRAHIPSPWWRLVLSGTLVFLPIAGVEMLDNGVNLQWYALCATFWALLWRPRGFWPRATQTALCLFAAASDPLALLFLPLVAARLFAVRDWREQAPVAAWATGLVVQGITALSTTVPHSTTHAGAGTMLRLAALRVLTPFFLGDHGTQRVFAHGGWPAIDVCAAGFGGMVVAGLVLLARRCFPARVGWLAAVSLAVAVLFFVVPVETRWTPLYVPVGRSVQFLGLGSRYVAVPLIALWSVAIAALAAGWNQRSIRVAGVLAVVLFGGMWVVDFSATGNSRDLGPRWSDALAAARATCIKTGASTVRILTPPPNGLWTVEVSCRDVLG